MSFWKKTTCASKIHRRRSYGHQKNLVQLHKVEQLNIPELTKAVMLTFLYKAYWFGLHLNISCSSLIYYLGPPETLGDLRTLKVLNSHVRCTKLKGNDQLASQPNPSGSQVLQTPTCRWLVQLPQSAFYLHRRYRIR